MRIGFRSLSTKLTVLFVAIFGALELALWVIVDLVLMGDMMRSFDRTLVDRAQSIAESLEAREEPPDGQESVATLRRLLEPFEAPAVFIQVTLGGSGKVVRSRNLRGIELPRPEPSEADDVTPQLRTIEGPIVEALGVQGNALRLATLHVNASPLGNYDLQVAADLFPVESSSGDLHQLLAVFIFVSLMLAGVTAWWLTRRSLGSVGQIARQAREINASELNRRLSVPDVESELSQVIEVINDMLARLEREFEIQRRFMAEVSHELKTPLAVVLGEAQALQRHEIDNREVTDFLSAVVGEVQQLLRTVEGFLILARTQPGKVLQVARAVSMEDVVMKAVRRCQRDGEQREVRVIPTFDSSEAAMEPFVDGDDELLVSMAENLIRNAIRHSPPKEGVFVRLLTAIKEVDLEVSDRGSGIPAPQMDRVFDMYYQASSPDARRGQGGIGLAIVKAVAEIHGGTVSVRNGETCGCSFIVRLPISPRC